MTLILIRHAHRDTKIRALDNGLSEKGKTQARNLARYFRSRFKKGPTPLVLISSPKRRCVQTLEPIAKALGAKIRISELLSEQRFPESEAAFEKRVIQYSRELFKKRGVVVVCSHGDWMPLALKHLVGADVELRKGSWTELENGRLVRILQPDDLA